MSLRTRNGDLESSRKLPTSTKPPVQEVTKPPEVITPPTEPIIPPVYTVAKPTQPVMTYEERARRTERARLYYYSLSKMQQNTITAKYGEYKNKHTGMVNVMDIWIWIYSNNPNGVEEFYKNRTALKPKPIVPPPSVQGETSLPPKVETIKPAGMPKEAIGVGKIVQTEPISYPEDTSTVVPPKDEFKEGTTDTTPSTTPKLKLVDKVTGETTTFSSEAEFEAALEKDIQEYNDGLIKQGEEKSKKTIYALMLALGVLTLGVLL